MKAKRITTLLALLLMAGGTMQAQQWEFDFGDQNDINQYSRTAFVRICRKCC